ncbi:hypothetical protein FNF29_05403 [Cafeteria roenbergensis]|uniref:Arf-GAP domain-containing protein n=1 Tax=Cafeteria roenbergensis TaxID=33653 RepID=A0A5A8CAM5_CAFRO|nr:hypothetical protein FNF29_05403 [Cafeteria roenbergensis]|eukprot:KAA0150162.1 hypothetical protein FNF29_05403 [Cafeteria roenbergensis]
MQPALIQEICAMPGNGACVDCLTPKPQWASVSFGTLLCLDCAGRHRGLGVHISFVRSVQMDAWKDAQIDAMKVGGNQALQDFFRRQGIIDEPIANKYNSAAAAWYRERIRCLRQGDPAPSESTIKDFEAAAMWHPGDAAPSSAPPRRVGLGAGAPSGIGSSAPSRPTRDSRADSDDALAQTAAQAWSFLSSAVTSGAAVVSSSAAVAAERLRQARLAERLSEGVGSISDQVRSGEAARTVTSSASAFWSSATAGASSLWTTAATHGSTFVDSVAKSVTEMEGPGDALSRHSDVARDRRAREEAMRMAPPPGSKLPGIDADSPLPQSRPQAAAAAAAAEPVASDMGWDDSGWDSDVVGDDDARDAVGQPAPRSDPAPKGPAAPVASPPASASPQRAATASGSTYASKAAAPAPAVVAAQTAAAEAGGFDDDAWGEFDLEDEEAGTGSGAAPDAAKPAAPTAAAAPAESAQKASQASGAGDDDDAMWADLDQDMADLGLDEDGVAP